MKESILAATRNGSAGDRYYRKEDIPDREIDAGGKALREHIFGWRELRSWETLSFQRKKNWRKKAAVVLAAAMTVR